MNAATQDVALISREDAEEFTQSLGLISGGAWRQIALAKKLGVPAALGLSVEEWVEKRLGGYIRLSVSDRWKAVRQLEADGFSKKDTAEILGVGTTAVAEARASETPIRKRTGETVGNPEKSTTYENQGVRERTSDESGDDVPRPQDSAAIEAARKTIAGIRAMGVELPADSEIDDPVMFVINSAIPAMERRQRRAIAEKAEAIQERAAADVDRARREADAVIADSQARTARAVADAVAAEKAAALAAASASMAPSVPSVDPQKDLIPPSDKQAEERARNLKLVTFQTMRETLHGLMVIADSDCDAMLNLAFHPASRLTISISLQR